jgi:hypothetical protein
MKQAELAAREQSADHRPRATRSSGGARRWDRPAPRARSPRSCQKNGQADRHHRRRARVAARTAARRGGLRKLSLEGLREDRIPVVAGGSDHVGGVRRAGPRQMTVAEGALRDGVLWDLLGRVHHRDIREVTVDQFAQPLPRGPGAGAARGTSPRALRGTRRGRRARAREFLDWAGGCTRSACRSRRARTTSTPPTSSRMRTCPASRARSRDGCRTWCWRSAASSPRCARAFDDDRGWRDLALCLRWR